MAVLRILDVLRPWEPLGRRPPGLEASLPWVVAWRPLSSQPRWSKRRQEEPWAPGVRPAGRCRPHRPMGVHGERSWSH